MLIFDIGGCSVVACKCLFIIESLQSSYHVPQAPHLLRVYHKVTASALQDILILYDHKTLADSVAVEPFLDGYGAGHGSGRRVVLPAEYGLGRGGLVF